MQSVTFAMCDMVFTARCLSATSIRLNGSYNNWLYKNSTPDNYPIHNITRYICFTRPLNALNKESIIKRRRQKNLLEKYFKDKKKKSEKPVHEIWPNIKVNELASVLKIDPNDALELVLSSGDANSVKSVKSPITNKKVFSFIAKTLNCQFIEKPKITDTEERANKDIVKTPINFDDLVYRPPVIALVGHIDHGKTTLLDRLRSSSVVETECGGITQHIGTFSLTLGENQKMTFLDTPGHAAFKSMRVRGTNITDIVILVVDAVEGPLEQTLESIRAIRQSQCHMIVAINKIDRPEANVEKTKDALREHGVQFEEEGGNVPCVPISALNGTNVDELIETVIVQSEVLQLTGDPKGPVEGTIVESTMERGFGGTATVLVKRGTLRKGTYLVSGTTYAKVKLLLDTSAALEKENRRELKLALPAEGCKVAGWKGVPEVGSEVLQVESEKRAKEVVQWRIKEEEELKINKDLQEISKKRELDYNQYVEYRKAKLAKGFMKMKYGWLDEKSRTKEMAEDDETPKVSILLKFDVDGSKDAILSCLDTYDNESVRLDVINAEIGDVTQEDVEYASNFKVIKYYCTAISL